MSPTSHAHSKQQCPKCANADKSTSMTLTTQRFVEKSKAVHGQTTYCYSAVDYVNAHTKVDIRCPIHGMFSQIPTNHTDNKAGCPKCVGKQKTTKQFVEEAHQVHSSLYDYSQVDYTLSTTPVDIICRLHGKFSQKPTVHLGGSGCPKCWSTKGERKIEYFLHSNNIVFETEKRFSDCRGTLPLPFDFWLPVNNLLIEYDGEIHFKYIKHIHKTPANFIRTQEHDLSLIHI